MQGMVKVFILQVLVCPEKSRPEENKEQAILEYTAAVDAWAIGIVCFELLVGHPPFEKKSQSQTYEHIMYRAPVIPSIVGPGAKNFISSALIKVLTDPIMPSHASQCLCSTNILPDKALCLHRWSFCKGIEELFCEDAAVMRSLFFCKLMKASIKINKILCLTRKCFHASSSSFIYCRWWPRASLTMHQTLNTNHYSRTELFPDIASDRQIICWSQSLN